MFLPFVDPAQFSPVTNADGFCFGDDDALTIDAPVQFAS